MTPLKIKTLKIAFIVSSEIFLLMCLRYSMKTTLFLWREHKALYDFHNIILRKALEQNPDLFEDSEIQQYLINYEFGHLVSNIQENE